MIKVIFLLLLGLSSTLLPAQELHRLDFGSVAETQSFFSYHNRDSVGPIISGHRGGAVQKYPENSIEALEHTLRATPAVFEIDVRLTNDGRAVLLHDASLDRTTTGSGKIRDHSLKELRNLRRKNPQGKLTDIGILTLEQAIQWAKGRTLINLDVKDVPGEMKVALVKKFNAFPYVIFTVHSPEEARAFLEQDPRSMFSAFIKTPEAFRAYEDAGIPWENILMGYVGPWSKPENGELYDLLHEKGVRVMVSAASSYDKLEDPEARAEAYRKIIEEGADILETDRPIEAAAAIAPYLNQNINN